MLDPIDSPTTKSRSTFPGGSNFKVQVPFSSKARINLVHGCLPISFVMDACQLHLFISFFQRYKENTNGFPTTKLIKLVLVKRREPSNLKVGGS